MLSRSADATIKGYYYQFNKTLESLLDLPNLSDSIQIEGVEDIDISTLSGVDYVQCKYYSSLTLTNSAIREAVILMLEGYKKKYPSKDLKYTLYGYFKNETTPKIIVYNLAELKTMLTYTESGVNKAYHIDNSISDTILTDFLSVFSVVVGKEFNLQRVDVINKIKKQFLCSDFDAEYNYYNNALRTILDKAIKKVDTERLISKKDFLASINTGKVLFFEWFKKYKDQSQYLLLLKNQIKSHNLFGSGKDRMLVLGKHLNFADPSLPLEVFIENLIEKFYKFSRSAYTTKPLTLIVDLTDKEIIALKSSLILKRLQINDGWETISFNGHLFSEEPVINKSKAGFITKSSYLIRLISYRTFVANFSSITKRFSILYISEDALIIPEILVNQIVEVKYLNTLPELYTILN